MLSSSGIPAAPTLGSIQTIFASANAVVPADDGAGGKFKVLENNLDVAGHCLTTSPNSDSIVGFSGPTNCLIGLKDEKIVGVSVLTSGDTQEHVDQVVNDRRFWQQFENQTATELSGNNFDAVSGATLTSIAIVESISNRLGAGRRASKFKKHLLIEDVHKIFPAAKRLYQPTVSSSMFNVYGERDQRIGKLLRTSPAGDQIIGFQGPTDCLIGFDLNDRVLGVQIRDSFDNEPYVGYVKDEPSFAKNLAGKTLDDLSKLTLDDGRFDGVSGATMTSQSIFAAVKMASIEQMTNGWTIRWRDYTTIAIVLASITIGSTRLRGFSLLRIALQLLLIGYLGLVNGDMLSQALIGGWAQTNIPWENALGLVFLSAAAFTIPILSKRNLYCTHVCPHGALQELISNRLPWKIRLGGRMKGALKFIPGLLLFWCLFVSILNLPVSLVGIEPFNAWVFRIAGWSTIAVASIGLFASLFIPMAYCKFGCPTGALLNFLRFNSYSDRWNRSDTFAVAMLLFASAVTLFAGGP